MTVYSKSSSTHALAATACFVALSLAQATSSSPEEVNNAARPFLSSSLHQQRGLLRSRSSASSSENSGGGGFLARWMDGIFGTSGDEATPVVPRRLEDADGGFVYPPTYSPTPISNGQPAPSSPTGETQSFPSSPTTTPGTTNPAPAPPAPPSTADVCGVKGGDGTSCLDACGVPNGDASSCADQCGKQTPPLLPHCASDDVCVF